MKTPKNPIPKDPISKDKDESIIKPTHPIDSRWGPDWADNLIKFRELWDAGELTECPFCNHPLPRLRPTEPVKGLD